MNKMKLLIFSKEGLFPNVNFKIDIERIQNSMELKKLTDFIQAQWSVIWVMCTEWTLQLPNSVMVRETGVCGLDLGDKMA